MPISEERLTGSDHHYRSEKASGHTKLSVVVGCGQLGGWQGKTRGSFDAAKDCKAREFHK